MTDTEITGWMDRLAAKLAAAFGGRLQYVGLQGSHRRGEATDTSDIDAVVVLDRLEPEDLAVYREILDAMPARDKTCGFISGRAELAAWPHHELFQFRNDTRDWHGKIDDVVPPVSREDIEDSALVAASGMYHMLCHSYLHGGGDYAAVLPGLYKGAFFILLAAQYLRTGLYAPDKRTLLAALRGRERDILRAEIADPEAAFRLLFQWCGDILRKGVRDADS